MPRKRTTPPGDVELANLPAPPPLASSGAMTEREQRVDMELDEFMEEVGGEAIVKVARVNMETGTRAHCGDLPAEGFSLDTLADTFGGGRYWVRVMVNKRTEWRGQVEIDSAIPARNPRGAKLAAAQVSAPPSSNPVLDQMAGVMTAMMAASANGAQMMQQMAASQASSMSTMLAAVTTALAAKKDTDPMEMMRTAAEIFRATSGGGGGDTDKLLGMLKEGMELGKLVGGGGEADTPALIGKGLDALTAIVSGGQRPPDAAPVVPGPQLVREAPQPPRVMLQPPRPEHVERILENPDVPSPTEDQTVRPWVREARSRAPQLRMLAGMGLNPESAVDMIVKGAPQAMWDDLCAFYDEAPDTFDARMVAELPLLIELGEWGQALVAELRQAIVEAGEEDDGGTDATEQGH